MDHLKCQSQTSMKADHHEGGVKIDKNSISVHSTGEISLIPDAIQFTVTVTSNKETVEEAQASVKRRTDYVSQVVRKTGIHSEIPMSTEITKSSGGMTSASQGDMVTVCTEVVVKCDSLNKCETIKNVLIEKMDSSVHFSPVAFWLSAEAKQNGRQEAFKRAVTSAKAKAECISQTVGVQLGAALQVKEVSQDSAPTVRAEARGSMDRMSKDFDSATQVSLSQHHHSLNQRLINASVTFSSKVYTCFETLPLSRRSSKHF